MQIATLVRQCLESFGDVINLESNDPDTADQIHDESGRFRIWAGNASAHTTGRRSLQHRLRDSPELSSAVVKYLQDLLVAIENMKLLSSHNDGNMSSHLQVAQTCHTSTSVGDGIDYDEEDDDLFGDVEFSPSADGALEETRDLISCLFRLSMAFRNPARNDEIRHASMTLTSFYEPHDIQHVSSKFPSISSGLNEKLGRAISRRRQYFKYREEHHQKLASDLDHMGEDTSTVATSLPSVQPRLASDTYNTDTESLYTATSYAPTETGDSLLRYPERPKTATGDMPFECPLCYHIITASDERSWRQHVHEDLLPYVCLHEDCLNAARQYAHRREWRRHMESHERHWLCPYNCSDTFVSGEGFEEHLQVEHLVEVPMLAALSKSCASEPGMATSRACTLCEHPIIASGLWFEHVGHHLEQLALFALPSHLLFNDSDIDRDGMEEMPSETADVENVNDPLSDHGVIEGRLVHGNMDSEDGVEDLSENIVLESWDELLQAEVLDDSKLVAHSRSPPSPQDHKDTHITDRHSSPVLNHDQPTTAALEKAKETYRCPHCSTTFRRYHNLKSHLLTHLHQNIKDRLSLQDSAVPSDRQPNRAVQGSTGKERRCPYCSTTFERSQDFRNHLLTHSTEEPYVCHTCDARFRRLHDLKRHYKLHTGERPHTCDTCGRKFARADALARHTNPICAGRRVSIEHEVVDKKGIDEAEYAEEDLDMYETIENIDTLNEDLEMYETIENIDTLNEDLDMYETIEYIDTLNEDQPIRARRKLDLPRMYGPVDDL